MSQVLSFKDVTLKFGGITALNSVSFEVNPDKQPQGFEQITFTL